MAKSRYWASLTAIVILEVMITMTPAAAVTVPSDVEALQELYKNLNNPSELLGWTSIGGDPCGESWTGVSCDAASVINITLPGLGLRGYLGRQLNLPNLKELNISGNEIQGNIPALLPPDLTYINLSHNTLSGSIGDHFSDLQNLKRMDLSHNNLTGDLPSSFGNLTSLTGLFLENNQFTGSVNSLANLPLTDLNIQNNNFSGAVPKQFQRVQNLWIWKNEFQNGDDSPPRNLPHDTIPIDQKLNSPPAIGLSSTENHPCLRLGTLEHRRFSAVGIASGIFGAAFVVICVVAGIVLVICFRRSRKQNSKKMMLPISTKDGPHTRSVIVELRMVLPMYLSVFAILITISFSCTVKWYFVIFLGMCGLYFSWLGCEACQEIARMEESKEEPHDVVQPLIAAKEESKNETLDNVQGPNVGEEESQRGPLQEARTLNDSEMRNRDEERGNRSCCLLSDYTKVSILTSFSLFFILLLMVHVFTRACDL